MVPEQKVDFIHRQGKTFRNNLYLSDTDGNNIDLTGCTAKMQLRVSVEDDDVALELSTENNRIAIIGEFGQISLYVEAEDTASLTAQNYVYDLEIYHPGGDVSSPAFGKFKIRPEVTR